MKKEINRNKIILIVDWLNKFPSDKYFKSNANIREFMTDIDLYKIIEDFTGGAK